MRLHLSQYLGSLFLLSIYVWADTRTKIVVSIVPEQSLESTYTVTKLATGFECYNIIITNKGTQAVTLQNIDVRIPIDAVVSPEMEISYGSSCMGQRPVLRHKLGSPQSDSESFMYAMVQRAEDDYLFAGVLSWRVCIPVIRLKDNAFVVSSTGVGKQIKAGESVNYERIVVKRGNDWYKTLKDFAVAIAKENGISFVKTANFKGWATWDYYAYVFTADDIYRNMVEIQKLDASANLIQIDAGWYAIRGDYTTDRPDLAGGIKNVTVHIKAAGMMPGLWMDGFRASSSSQICKEHPEYFLKDENGNMIVQVRKSAGLDRDRVYFDYSHPGARAHLSTMIRHIREELGVPYFKIDFMRFGLNKEILKANPKVKRVIAYDMTLTDVERMRLGLKVMREAVGPNNYLLGCSAVFGPCIGFVDGMRTGGDINPKFEDFPERVLGNLGNAYLHQQVFNVDADYLVFRAAADEDDKVSKEIVKRGGTLSLNEAKMWADFNKLYGSCRLSSDNLALLRPERKSLLTETMNYPVMDEVSVLDYWQRAKDKTDCFELVLSRHEKDIYLGIFNWSNEAKDYNILHFNGLHRLDGRQSKVLKYMGSLDFETLRRQLIPKPSVP